MGFMKKGNIMETMQIIVEVRNVYGNDLIYPVCQKAKTFADIAGQTTLTQRNIRFIKSLGYAVETAIKTVNKIAL